MKTDQAVRHFGSVTALARALGISHQAVCQWGDDVPELRAYQIERLTDGALAAVEASVSDAPGAA